MSGVNPSIPRIYNNQWEKAFLLELRKAGAYPKPYILNGIKGWKCAVQERPHTIPWVAWAKVRDRVAGPVGYSKIVCIAGIGHETGEVSVSQMEMHANFYLKNLNGTYEEVLRKVRSIPGSGRPVDQRFSLREILGF